MKRAFFVLGAESSGTRVLTRAFISAGCWGSDEHTQPLDNLIFSDSPDLIVFRRSLPHDFKWPDIIDIKQHIEKAGYDLITVGIVRDTDITALSQVRNQHVATVEKAEENIEKAIRIASLFVDAFIHYHTFVTDAWYRKERFEDFGLPEPDMDFYNGNEKYAHLVA